MSFERMLTYKGETLSVAEWSRRTGLKDNIIHMRLRAGWSVEKTLEKPLGNKFITKDPSSPTGLKAELKAKNERELIRSYLKTQPAHVEESREEGDIL